MKSSVSAIAVCCSSKKSIPVSSYLSQDTLRPGTQASLASQWLSRIAVSEDLERRRASTLYSGRGAVRAARLSADHDASFYVLSAGLGLVHGEQLVPAYDLTVSPGVTGAVPSLVHGRFSASQWWERVMSGRFARDPSGLLEGDGRIVIALSQPYADLVGAWLAGLPADGQKRLRLIGAGLDKHLPPALLTQIVRYDGRLDVVSPGVRANFAARALEHFMGLCAHVPATTASGDQSLVERSLKDVVARVPPRRNTLDDQVLAPIVVQLLSENTSVSAALKHLRERLGVACSDERFKRLAGGVGD